MPKIPSPSTSSSLIRTDNKNFPYSLTIPHYRLSLLANSRDNIQCSQRAEACKSLIVGQLQCVSMQDTKRERCL